MRSVALVLRDPDGTPAAMSVSAMCAVCGNHFQFVGVETTSTVLVNEDRTEVRLLIAEGAPDPVHRV